MIDERILSEFNSDEKTVIIKKIICDYDSCGQEILKIYTKQISKPFLNTIKGYDVVNKTLEVEGHLNLNDEKVFYTNLVGFVSNESVTKVSAESLTEEDILNNTYRLPTSHYIEIIKTNLNDEININFNKNYETLPNVIITIDKENEDLYNKYSTEFIKNSEDKYSGVKIIFSNLKARNSYPEINITIIGDPIESYYDSIIKTEAKAEIHFLEGVKRSIYIFELIDMVKNDIKNVKIIIKDSEDNQYVYHTDNCGKIYPILEYGEYTISIEDLKYDSSPQTITISENNTEIELAFLKKQANSESTSESTSEEGSGE